MGPWFSFAQKSPDSWIGHNNLGFAYFDAGRHEDAVKAWNRCVQVSRGQYADALAGLAMGLETLGRSDKADIAFAMAVSVASIYKDPDVLAAALWWSPQKARRLKKNAARHRAEFE